MLETIRPFATSCATWNGRCRPPLTPRLHPKRRPVKTHDGPLFLHEKASVAKARARNFPPLKDVNANNYLGNRSLESNLTLLPELIDEPLRLPSLEDADFGRLLVGLENALPKAHREKF